jgi:PIN domain nuclease of toxin-antitoxin system
LKLLLDTHIWLWSLTEPERLAPVVRRELDDRSNQLWLSPVSVWEALLLHSKRKIRLHEDIAKWVAQATSHLQEAPLTHQVVLAAQQLGFSHSDPADRFLAATAKVLELMLVTADQRLLSLPDIQVLENR